MIIILAGALILMFAFLIVMAYRLDVVTEMVAQHDEELDILFGDCECMEGNFQAINDEIEIANMMRELDSLNKKTPKKGKKDLTKK